MRADVSTVLLVVLFSVVAACDAGGSAAGLKSPREVIAAAPTAVTEAGTSRYWLQLELDTGDPSSRVAIEGHGVMRYPTAFSFEGVATFGGRDATYEVRVLDNEMFFRNSIADEMVADTAPNWIHADLQDWSDEYGRGEPLADVLETAGAQDPSVTVELLRAVSDEVTEMGTEEVRGVGTTRYRVTTDPSMTPSAGASDSGGSLSADLLDRVPMDVWIDDDGLLRRVSYEVSVAGEHGGEPVTTSMTMEMFDYGANVTITEPTDGSTHPFSEYRKRGDG